MRSRSETGGFRIRSAEEALAPAVRLYRLALRLQPLAERSVLLWRIHQVSANGVPRQGHADSHPEMRAPETGVLEEDQHAHNRACTPRRETTTATYVAVSPQN